jgi:hypothetical protein
MAKEKSRWPTFFVGEFFPVNYWYVANQWTQFPLMCPSWLVIVVHWDPRHVNCNSPTCGIANSRNSPTLRHTLASQLNDYSTSVYNFNNLLVFWHKGGQSWSQIPEHVPFIVVFSAPPLTHLIPHKTGRWGKLMTAIFCQWITALLKTRHHYVTPHHIIVFLSPRRWPTFFVGE